MLQPTSEPTVSVVVSARNEAGTIGAIVERLVGLGPPVVEVLVVDDGSSDATAQLAADAGARVIDGHADGPGKGQAMWQGVSEAQGEVIVFCDADLVDFDPSYVTNLVAALVADEGAVLVKGRYPRSGTGGRVNELVARPVLELLHPALAFLAQPLGGEYAAWRHALATVPFVHGYGVDVGLVLDLAARFGPGSIIETDLSERRHRNRSLDELRPQARLVLEVALHRAGLTDAAVAECPPLGEVAALDRRNRRSA